MPDTLDALLAGYRAGDPDAQRQLLKAIEPLLLRYVKRDMGVQARTLEQSVDLSQSLLLALHIGLSSGKAELRDEAALRAYLKTMVRNKLANRSDRAKAAKRGGGRAPVSLERGGGKGDEDDARLQIPARDLTASRVYRITEMRQRLDNELTPEEQSIFEGRLRGDSYVEIAHDLGRTPDGVRMLWKRARERLVARGIVASPDRPRPQA